MQLWYATTSPFARKVRIAAHELGLDARIALFEVDPWRDSRLRAINPLAKVPTLVAETGEVVCESSVICDYLDSLASPRRLHPQEGPERWQALRLQGLADGASTAAGRLYADERRPQDQRAEAMMGRFRLAIDAVLDELEADGSLEDRPTIGEIAVAAFLGYLDFRWPERNWKTARPALAAWHERFSQRPSMTSTRHRPPAAGALKPAAAESLRHH